MAQAYSDPERETDEHALPNVEIFYLDKPHSFEWGDEPCEPGWYYWFCFPGCLPDSDPMGPYETEAKALEAAQEDSE